MPRVRLSKWKCPSCDNEFIAYVKLNDKPTCNSRKHPSTKHTMEEVNVRAQEGRP
jgi:hypothetical protein